MNIVDGTASQRLCDQLGKNQLSKVRTNIRVYANRPLKFDNHQVYSKQQEI